MNILVTGATGFIGKALINKLLQYKNRIIILARNKKKAFSLFKDVEVLEADISDSAKMDVIAASLSLQKIDMLIHLAASLDFSGSWNELFNVNVKGSVNLLDLAVKCGIRRFIYASSIEAQGPGRIEDVPLTEKDSCRPVSDYGRSKLEAEEKVIEYEKAFGLKTVVARIGNVYGVGSPSFVYPIVEAIFTKNPFLGYLPLFNERLIQPIYINDLVEGLLSMIQKDDRISGIYNFTGNSPVAAGRWFRVVASFLKREKIVDQYINRTLSEDNTVIAKEIHPNIKYFLSGDKPYIHRAYTDEKLRRAIGDYEHFNILKGTAYTIEWLYKSGLFKRWM